MLRIETAHVFDWIITTDPGLVTLVASDLEGFFSLDRLATRPPGVVIDRPTDTRFVHEFPAGSDIAAQHAHHAGRIAMLVERWRNLLASNQRVLFVRQGWEGTTPSSAVTLRDTIRRQAPRLRFAMLYLTDDPADDVSWNAEGIMNRYLAQTEPYDWKGDNRAWEQLLREALATDIGA